MNNKLLVVCGPTAAGKTALAVELAKKFNGELVSADSRQVYKGMDIGTGKDLGNKISNIKYQISNIHIKNKKYNLIPYDLRCVFMWMIDIVNPSEKFSVSHYNEFAERVIADIRNRGKLPIVVGGTGLYISSLLSPVETSHIPPNTLLRKQLQTMERDELQQLLQKEHPPAWESMNASDRQNPRRLMRKIEIAKYQQRYKDTKFQRNKGKVIQMNKDILIIGLRAPFPLLYQLIDARVDRRMQQGLLKEIRSLLDKGYSWDLPAMSGLGYREWKDFFKTSAISHQPSDRETQMQSIVQRWKWDEHGYARRQMTWFRNVAGISWFDISREGWAESVESSVRSWYTTKAVCCPK